MHESIYVYMHVCRHSYINLYVWMYVGKHVCMPGWIDICRTACMYVCMYVCMCTYTYIHACRM